MSVIRQRLLAGMNKIIHVAGRPIMLQFYSQTVGSVWNDEVSLVQSGADLWTSGVILPLDNSKGSADSFLVEQGKITNDDIKLFTHGSLLFIGNDLKVRIQLGSENPLYYSFIGPITRTEVQGGPVYKKVFIRQITHPGSLI